MTQENVYNVCMLLGIVLIGSGVALISIPAALITVGTLVIALTFASAVVSRKG